MAAQVETLKVLWPSPPVPTMSTASGGASTGSMRSRIRREAPVISEMVSPRTRSAMRKAAICTGLATPDIMVSKASTISSSASEAPLATFCMRSFSSMAGMSGLSGGVAGGWSVAAARAQAGELQEVGEQRVALLRGDALGVELYPMHRDASYAAGP